MKKILFFLIINGLLSSCHENKKPENFKLTIQLSNPLPELKINDPLPEYITKLIQPIEITQDTIFIPEVIIERSDINSEGPFKIVIPSTIINKAKKIADTYDYEDLKSDYEQNLDKIKVDEYLVKNGNISKEENNESDKSNSTVFEIDFSDENGIDSVINLYKNVLRKKGKSVKVLLKNKKPENLQNSNVEDEIVIKHAYSTDATPPLVRYKCPPKIIREPNSNTFNWCKEDLVNKISIDISPAKAGYSYPITGHYKIESGSESFETPIQPAGRHKNNLYNIKIVELTPNGKSIVKSKVLRNTKFDCDKSPVSFTFSSNK
jgi:hypothetical protein